MPNKRYNIWLDLTLIDRIKAAAKKTGVKVSTYIRMAVLEKLDKNDRHENNPQPPSGMV